MMGYQDVKCLCGSRNLTDGGLEVEDELTILVNHTCDECGLDLVMEYRLVSISEDEEV